MNLSRLMLRMTARDSRSGEGAAARAQRCAWDGAGAPNQANARRFVAFMLDAATERQLAAVAARHVPRKNGS